VHALGEVEEEGGEAGGGEVGFLVVGDLADCAVGGDGGVRGGGCWMFGGMTGGREKDEGKRKGCGVGTGGEGGGRDDKKCGKTIEAMRHQRQYPLFKKNE